MPGQDGRGSAGGGMGRMGGNGGGAGGFCICTNCGHKQPHDRGQPCTSLRCPNCGSPLSRE